MLVDARDSLYFILERALKDLVWLNLFLTFLIAKNTRNELSPDQNWF